jgi:dimeric dUTPase (all-alpha-NTP-PPase superfamily)
MNLEKLFKLQAELDRRIEQEHPRHPREDRLKKKILALLVELGELANEWRGFKFWSNNQEPRIVEYRDCPYCGGHGVIDCFPLGAPDETYAYEDQCPECVGGQVEYNPLLEEYVDCLHFILSIGLELNVPEIYGTSTKWDELTSDETDITKQFLIVFENVNKLVHPIDWINLFEEFYILGEMLGFTWEEVEQAYMKKNAINHKRQEVGY